MRDDQSRDRYERPMVKTFTTSEVLEWIGPAQGMSSGYGGNGPGGPVGAYPSQFGPGGFRKLDG